MIAVDTNILVEAGNRKGREHVPAREAMERLAAAGSWGLPLTVACEFVAVTTNARIWKHGALPAADAFGALDQMLGVGGAVLLPEPAGLLPRMRSLVLASGVSGASVDDARIAAVCLANGVTELWTADRDYGRYPGLRVVNPLVG